MATKLKFELMASNGTYQKDGEEKKRWVRCGTCFENDKGQLSIKLDVVPAGPEWSGWFSLFEPKEQGRDRTPQDSYRQPQGGQQRQPQPREYDDSDEGSIPF